MIIVCKGHNSCERRFECYHSKTHKSIEGYQFYGNCWNVLEPFTKLNELCSCISLKQDRREKLEKLKNE